MARRLGIEPRFTASKAAVLPLDDLRRAELWRYHTVEPVARQLGGSPSQDPYPPGKLKVLYEKNPYRRPDRSCTYRSPYH